MHRGYAQEVLQTHCCASETLSAVLLLKEAGEIVAFADDPTKYSVEFSWNSLKTLLTNALRSLDGGFFQSLVMRGQDHTIVAYDLGDGYVLLGLASEEVAQESLTHEIELCAHILPTNASSARNSTSSISHLSWPS